MRILLLTLYFQPDIAANSVIMTKLMEQLIDKGHEVTVVTAFPHYDINRIWDAYRGKLVQKEKKDSLTVYRSYLYLPSKKNSIVGRLLSYASFNAFTTLVGLFAGKHDIILAPSPPLTIGLSAYVISYLRNVPYIYNVQDIYPDVAIRLGVLSNRWLISFFRALERFVYDQAVAISVLSNGFRRNLLNKGVQPNKIHVIPNFVDSEFVRPLPRDNDFSHKMDLNGQYLVLFAGNIGYSQGLTFVLDTARLLSTHSDILFLIVGNGVAKSSLVEKAERLGLENVRFLPFQHMGVVPQMYASSDLCLVPLRHHISRDSVPSKVYTIMAAGKPLIAAVDEHSDTWNLIREKGCGLLVPPENPQAMAKAILELYEDRLTASDMGRKGRQCVEAQFTPQVVAQQYETLLYELMNSM
jgi:colanic acid biosynthesis glycosyl transferase WcaI